MPIHNNTPLTIPLTEPQYHLISRRASACESARLTAESAQLALQREVAAYNDVITSFGLDAGAADGTQFAKAETSAKGKVYTLTLHPISEIQPATPIKLVDKEQQTS